MVLANMLFTTKRARSDTGIAISYLTTRVREPDQSDWLKMVNLFMYIRGTNNIHLILSAENNGMLKWYIDGSYDVHPNMRGPTGGGLTMGRGFPISALSKQKTNTRSFTESEIVWVDQLMPLVRFQFHLLINDIEQDVFEAQGYIFTENIFYQDNKHAILLEKNSESLNRKHMKHITKRFLYQIGFAKAKYQWSGVPWMKWLGISWLNQINDIFSNNLVTSSW